MPKSGGDIEMNRGTHRILHIISLLAAIAGVVVFIGWGSNWFRNWNIKTWFNSWGTAHAEAMTVEDVSAAVRTSSDNNLTYDSDDGTMTVAVTKLSRPRFLFNGDRFDFYTVGTFVSGGKLNVGIYDNMFGTYFSPFHTFTFTYDSTGTSSGSKSTVFSVSLEEIKSVLESNYKSVTGDSNCRFAIYNAAIGNYTESDYTISGRLYFPETSLDPVWDESYTKFTLSNIGEFPLSKSEATGSYKTVSGYRMYVNQTYFPGTAPQSYAYAYSSCNEGGHSDKEFLTYHKYLSNIGVIENNTVIVDLKTQDFIDKCPSSFSLTIEPVILSSPSSMGETPSYEVIYSYEAISFNVGQLAVPTEIKYDAGIITWNAVDNANAYAVFIETADRGTVTEYTTETTFDAKNVISATGEYTVRIRALGNIAEHMIAQGLTMSLSPFNASNVITQLVALTLNIDGDSITKLVPYGKNISEYLYDVEVPNKVFGGWFYDSGYSNKVSDTDVLNGDVTLYARLSDSEVVPERSASWWDLHKWQVLIPVFVAVGLIVVGITAFAIKKKRGK